MKKTLLTCLAIALSIALNAQTWTLLTTNSSSNLKGIHFPTALIGYAVGDNGTILKTTDGGTTWNSITTLFPGDWFWDVHFVNADTGYVVGETDPGSNPCGLGIIIKTTDGGATWLTLASGLASPVRDLFVLDKDTVFVCGGAEQTSGRIARSYDGGVTWTPIGLTYYDAMLGGLYFLNSQHGYCGVYESVFGTYNPGLATWLSTIDGGTTFATNVIPSSISYWNFASDFPDPSHGYITRSTYVGSDSVYLRKTTDGGTIWNEKAIPSFVGSIYGLDFVTASVGYIVGASGVIRTTVDGGSSWSTQTSPSAEDLRSVYFVNSDLGFAAGANGVILKFTKPTSVAEANASKASVRVYPNPSSDLITIQLNSKNSVTSFNITDMMGRVAIQGQINSETTDVNILKLADGIYTLNLDGQDHQSLKLIKN